MEWIYGVGCGAGRDRDRNTRPGPDRLSTGTWPGRDVGLRCMRMEGDHCMGCPKRWCWRSPGGGRVGPLTILSSLSLSSHCFSISLSFFYQSAVFPPPPAFFPFPSPGLSQERPEATAALGCAVAAPCSLTRGGRSHGSLGLRGGYSAAPSQEGAEATAALGCAVAAPAAVRSGGAAILAALPAARGAALLARGAGRPFCHSWQLGLGGSRQREPSGLGVPGRLPVP